VGHSQVNTALLKGTQGNFDTCPRCNGTVFEAEKIVSKHNLYHKSCLTCFQCKHPMDASSFFDASDGQVYCRGCYSTK
jgi:hypothetical protein